MCSCVHEEGGLACRMGVVSVRGVAWNDDSADEFAHLPLCLTASSSLPACKALLASCLLE